MYKALRLSQNSCGVVNKGIPMSRNMKVSQVSSSILEAIERYSASELERAIVGCLLEHQEIQLAPEKTQNQ